MTRLLALLALAALPGCGAISALSQAATPLEAYALTPADPPPSAATTSRLLVVEVPTAAGGIDTDRILVKPSPLQAEYLPGARWIDTAPDLVQSLLIGSLQDSGAFRHVGRPATAPLPDYTLLTEIRAFQAEATTVEGPPYRTRVRLVVSLVREEDRQIVGSRAVEAEAFAPSLEPPAVIPAFNQATDDALRQVVEWLRSTFGLTS